MVFACGCPTGGAKDWICRVCGLCPEHCKCSGDTFTHISTKEGVYAARAALTRLRDKDARAAQLRKNLAETGEAEKF